MSVQAMLQASRFSELIRIVSITTTSQSVQYVYVKFHNMDVLSYAKNFLVYGGKVDEFVESFIIRQTKTTQLYSTFEQDCIKQSVHSDIH